MASSRRVPTSENVSTYGAGQTYTALGTWEADTDNDLVTATHGEGLACLAAVYDDRVSMGGSTVNSSYWRRIYPQASNFHNGNPASGVRFFSTSTSNAMQPQENPSQIQDIVAKVTVNDAATVRVFNHQTTNAVAVGCIQIDSNNSGAGGIDAFFANGGGMFINCLSIRNELEGFRSNGNCTFYNCTAISNTADGFEATATTCLLKNCLSHGNTGADFTGTYSSSSVNNASEDATGDDVGTNCRASQTFTFAGGFTDDYHLSSSDAGAKDFGVDLSGDATYAFDDDIDAATRSGSWDIGFDEVSGGGGGTTRGTPFGHRGTAFNGGRTLQGPLMACEVAA